MDFTKMLRARGCKYLLVFVCTFSGGGSFPHMDQEGLEGGQVPAKGDIPQFGIPFLLDQIMGQLLWPRWYSW
jgi:hypothetical protein